MCWSSMSIPEKKVANKDINVLKIVHKGGYAYYKNFKYELNTLYKIDKEIEIIKSDYFENIEEYEIFEGFHSYNIDKVYIKDFLNNKGLFNGDCMLMIINPTAIKMNCIIPKGTSYYENKYGEIVSEAIKPISFKKIK